MIPITQSDKEYIKKLWDSGVSINDILRLMPYKINDTRKIIKQLCEEGFLEEKRKTKGEVTREKVIALYKSGVENPFDISAELGIAMSTVYQYLKDYRGIVKRTRHNWRPIKKYKTTDKTQEILQEICNGQLKDIEIARKYGVTKQWIYQLKKKNKENENGRKTTN